MNYRDFPSCLENGTSNFLQEVHIPKATRWRCIVAWHLQKTTFNPIKTFKMTFDNLSPSCPRSRMAVFIEFARPSSSSKSSCSSKLKGRRISMSWWAYKTSNIWCEWDFFVVPVRYRRKESHTFSLCVTGTFFFRWVANFSAAWIYCAQGMWTLGTSVYSDEHFLTDFFVEQVLQIYQILVWNSEMYL